MKDRILYLGKEIILEETKERISSFHFNYARF